jgi:hypothetical protein
MIRRHDWHLDIPMEMQMNLKQAREVMDAQLSPNPPAYGDFVVAGRVIADHYRKHPEKLRPVYTTDWIRTGPMFDQPGRLPSATGDQPAYRRPERPAEFEREEARGVDLRSSWANIQGPSTPNPGEEVGADLVEALPGDVSSYFIARDPRTGKAALCRYRQPQIEAGLVGRSNGGTARTMNRDEGYYRRIAQKVSVQRELTGAVLKGINAANRKTWESHRG